MKWLRNQGIRFKIAAGTGLVLLPLLSLILFGITRYAQAELWRREVLAAENLNSIAAALISDAMMAGHKDTIQETLDNLGENAGGQFDSIAVYDDQSVLTSYATGFSGGRTVDVENFKVDTTDPTCAVCHELPAAERPPYTIVTVDGQETLRSVVPLVNEPRCQECHGTGLEVLGDSIVDLRMDRFQQTSRAITLGLNGSIAFAVLVVVFGLLFFSQRVIISPLAKLVDVSQAMVEGDLGRRVKIRNQDEIGELGVSFNEMAAQVQGTVQTLEQRVAERTSELEESAGYLERRATQFEAVAQLARTITSIQDLETLLPNITKLVSQYFGFYHVGIFLLDNEREYAVLRATNSEGGQKMLARAHRLRVGQIGIVGYVTATGEPRIALNVGADAVYFDNPDLPDTRSEMALPLKSDADIIGALDVQSTEPDAFTEEDVNVLSTLADQVSTAILNARLYEEARDALEQAELASSQLTQRAWSDFQRMAPILGYRFDGNKPEPLTQSEDGQQAKVKGDSYSIPVQLRGEVIGSLSVSPPSDGHEWSEDEITLISATAERVALAAENARLVLESQKRASKEQTISEISSKIGAAINLDNIMQTTLREMGRILPGADISIEVENE